MQRIKDVRYAQERVCVKWGGDVIQASVLPRLERVTLPQPTYLGRRLSVGFGRESLYVRLCPSEVRGLGAEG